MNRVCKSCNQLKSVSEFAKAGFSAVTKKPQTRAVCKPCHSTYVSNREKEKRIANGGEYSTCSNEDCGHLWCSWYMHGKNVTVAKRKCPKCGARPCPTE